MDKPSPHVIISELQNILSPDRVLTAEEDCAFYSQDVYRCGERALAVVQTTTTDEVAACVTAIIQAGLALVPRGGGFSYTDGYTPTIADSVIIDTLRMKDIIEINSEDMYVTVQPGVTWEELDLALRAHGLRTPFWGPFSGKFATVGGSVTQNAVSFGSGNAGPAGDSLTGLEVVIGDGRVIQTGSGGGEFATAFFRHYGPDLTGLFSGDAGAFGVKTAISLRLIKRLPDVMCFTYNFPTYEAMLEGVGRVARENIVTESFGMDPELNKTNLARTENAGMGQALKNLLKVGAAGRNPISGLGQMIKVAMAGTSVFDENNYSYHFAVEGRDQGEVKAKARALRAACDPHGTEVPNTVPAVFRAEPWQPMNNAILHPTGMRWIPTHGVMPFSKAKAFHDDLMELYEELADEIKANKLVIAAMYTTTLNGFLYEPVLYWEDELELFHTRIIDADVLPLFQKYEKNESGRAFVGTLRKRIVELFHKHGSIHFQVGKVYPLLRGRNAPSVTLMRSIKQEVDPLNLMNPGALGL